MKYIIHNTYCRDLICCDNLASAEELILSFAEEEAFFEFNYAINVEDEADTLEEYLEYLREWWNMDDETNECICLFAGGINFNIGQVPYVED